MNENKGDTAGVIAPPPLIYGSALGIGLLLQRRFPTAFLPPAVARPLGAVLIGLGAIIAPLALATMRRARTSPNPLSPTTAIVAEGPFQFSRNPIYLAFTLIYAGIAARTNGLWALLLLPGVLLLMRRGVIDREERYLEQKFGAEYLYYKERVRRWI